MKSKSLAIALVGASIVAALVVLMVLQKGRVALFDGPKIEASSTRPVEVDADKADGTPTSPEVDTGMAELPANYRAGANELWDVSPTPLEQLVELGYSLEPDVIADLLLDRTKDPDTRVVAAFSAAQLMDRNLLSTLYQAATEPDVSVRTAAISAMGFMPSEKTIPVLKKVLAEDLAELPRSSAVTVLRIIGSEEAGIVLADVALNDSESAQTRLNAIAGIGEIGSSKVCGRLIPLLESKNLNIRLESSVLLTSTYDSRFLPKLIESLSEDADLAIFVEAIDTLEQISGQEFSNPITDGPQKSRRQVLDWWEKTEKR
jgi:HEAT repeat protein